MGGHLFSLKTLLEFKRQIQDSSFYIRKHIFLNFKTKKLLVILLIQCRFDYTFFFWYPGLSQYLRKTFQITRLQRKIILKFFTIYGHGGHLNHVTQTVLKNL